MSQSGQRRAPVQSDLSIAIGDRIRRARKDQGVSLRDFAVELGVSPATMSAIENGRTYVSAVRLTEIAAVLNVPLEVLLHGGSPRMDPQQAAAARAQAARERGEWRVFETTTLDAPLQAALEVFLEVGYHGATMRDIARRAGLSVPGIYHHYPSKQDMLAAILNYSVEELVWRYEAALAEADDIYSRFTLAVECLVLFHTRRRDWAFLGRSEQRSLEGDAAVLTREKRVAAEHSLISLIEDGCKAEIFATPSPEISGRAVIMMCVGTVYWFREDGPHPPEVIAKQYVDLALKMVEHVETVPASARR